MGPVGDVVGQSVQIPAVVTTANLPPRGVRAAAATNFPISPSTASCCVCFRQPCKIFGLGRRESGNGGDSADGERRDGVVECLPVVPVHPALGIGSRFGRVAFQLGQVDLWLYLTNVLRRLPGIIPTDTAAQG